MEIQAEKAAEELKRLRGENAAAALNAQQEIESLLSTRRALETEVATLRPLRGSPGGRTSMSIPITAPSQNALLTFSGAAGQVVSAYASTPWFGCIDSPHVYLKIVAPNGTVVTTAYDACSGGTVFADHVTLPVAGTYTLVLDPIGMWTGTASLAAYTFTDVTGPIVPNGRSVPVPIAWPGQNARLTFYATA